MRTPRPNQRGPRLWLHQRNDRPWRRWRDDRGSLPMALLVILIGVALAALLIPMVIMQNSTTRFDARRAVALQAAETGLDVALGLFRSTGSIVDNQVIGDPDELPCGTYSGTVGPDGAGTYSVEIAYYTKNPAGQGAAAGKMNCDAGYGVYLRDPVTESDIFVPSFVLLTSVGRSQPGAPARTLQGTYIVKTTNANISGGALPLFPEDNSTTTYCLDAGPNPDVGTHVVVQLCSSGNASVPVQQKWAYLSNLTIQLTATVGDQELNEDRTGLCIKSEGLGNKVTLARCPKDGKDNHGNPVPGDAGASLMWGINDNGHFEAADQDEPGLSGECLNVSNPSNGGAVTLKGCAGDTTDPHQAFNPMPSVGAGQAGPDNNQMVNFLLFGRCLDVTNQNTGGGDNGGTFLILYPCKQNPKAGAVAWNQKFTQVSVSGGVQWRTYPGDDPYCLTSPRTIGGYVHVTKCTDHPPAAGQVWTRYEAEDSDHNPLAFKIKYTMVDAKGLCMAQGPSDDMYKGNLKVIVAPCDGSTGQKWNADPNLQTPVLTNLHEITGSG